MSALQRQILADSPWLYWRLLETSGTTAVDASGNGRTGTYSGSPALATRSMLGVPYPNFDGSDDVVTGPNAPSITAGTVEAFIILDSLQAGSPFIRQIFGWEVSGNGFFLRIVNDDIECAAQRTGPVAAGAVSTGTEAALGSIMHVVGTWDGSNLRTYKNGVLIAGPTAFTGTINGGIAVYAARDNAGGRLYDGAIGECALYTTALSVERIAAHYRTFLRSQVAY